MKGKIETFNRGLVVKSILKDGSALVYHYTIKEPGKKAFDIDIRDYKCKMDFPPDFFLFSPIVRNALVSDEYTEMIRRDKMIESIQQTLK